MTKQSLSIKIPDAHYAGFHFRKNDIYPLAFLTPDGTDKQAQNRKATVDRWANGSSVKVPAKVFENKPMVGFKIGKNVRHSFSRSTMEKWRIIDPRGFELEISNANMSVIIETCIVDNGEIIDSCIWGREGQDNVLLPLSCDEYQLATANTARFSKSVSFKDVNIGDYVTYKNGNKGRYMGKYIKVLSTKYFTELDELIHSPKAKVMVFEENGIINHYSNIQISTIDKSDPISIADAEKYINDMLRSDPAEYRYSDQVVAYVSSLVEYKDLIVKKTYLPTVADVEDSKFYMGFLENKQTQDISYFDIYNLRATYRTAKAQYLIEQDPFKYEHRVKNIINHNLSRSYYNSLEAKTAPFDETMIGTKFDVFGMTISWTTKLGNKIEIHC